MVLRAVPRGMQPAGGACAQWWLHPIALDDEASGLALLLPSESPLAMGPEAQPFAVGAPGTQRLACRLGAPQPVALEPLRRSGSE